MTKSQAAPASIIDEKGEENPLFEFKDGELKAELRSWGFWLLGFGTFNLILSGFDGAFGTLLLLVGTASFYLQSPAMLMVIGVTLAWAALSNLAVIFIGDSIGGLFWSAVQLWLAYQVFDKYRGFRRHEQSGDTDGDGLGAVRFGPERAERLMPMLAAAAGLLAPLGFAAVFASGAMWYAYLGDSEPPQSYFTVMFTFAEIGVLGFAFGLASWLSGYRSRLLSAIGICAGLLMILVRIGLLIAALLQVP